MPRLRDWQIMLFIFLVGLPFSRTLAGGDMQNPIVALSASIVEQRTLTIDPYQTTSPDVAFHNGHYYSGMPPGTSLLAVPLYWGSKQALSLLPQWAITKIDGFIAYKKSRLQTSESLLHTPHYKEQILTHSLLSIIFAAALGSFSYFIICRIGLFLWSDAHLARIAGVTYAFATLMAQYHSSYITQAIALLFLLLAFWVLLVVRGRPLTCFLGATAAGFSGTIDYPYLLYGLIVVSCAVFFSNRLMDLKKRVLLLFSGFVFGFSPALIYHFLAFGNPFSPPYAFRARVRFHDTGFLGITWPSATRLRELFLSFDEGLLFLSPVCLLFVLGVWRILVKRGKNSSPRTKRLTLLMISLIAAGGLFFICVPWKSDMASFGPRFFLVALPFMTLLAVPAEGTGWKWTFALFALYGVVVNQLFLIGVRPEGLFSLLVPGSDVALGRFFLLHPFIRLDWATGVMFYCFWLTLCLLLTLLPAFLRQKAAPQKH